MELSELLETKQRELLAGRNAQRITDRSSFSNAALLWIALGPGWTPSLARNAGFPSGGSDAGQVLEEIASKGFALKSAAAPQLNVDFATGKASLAAPESLY